MVPSMSRASLIDLCLKSGIRGFIEAGINLESNYKLLKLQENYPDQLFPAVGIHPTRTYETPYKSRKIIQQLSLLPQVVAIGELGLDFHHSKKEQHRFNQYIWFYWQLKLACKRKLPLILHIRDAYDEALSVLRLFRNRLHGGVVHCFKGNPREARIYTEKFGFMLGIGGSLLQNSSFLQGLEESVRQTPLEYLLLETDGPYVSPARPETIPKNQWRKGKNTSLILPAIAIRIGEIKGVSPDEVEKITSQNAIRLFLRSQ